MASAKRQRRPGHGTAPASNRRPASRATRPARREMTSAQRVAWYCLHALVLLVPVAMSNWTALPGVSVPFTFDQFDIVKAVLMRGITLVAFAAWAWHVLVEGGSVRRTKVDYLILAVLGWIALSTILSIHVPTGVFGKYRRFEGLVSFVTYATMFFLAVQYLDRVSRIRSIARSLFISGTVVSFYGTLQYLGLDPYSWGRLPFEPNRAFSTFGNPDLLGGFIVFPLVVSLALALSERDHRWRIAYWAGFLLTVVCWVTAFTRGAWIGGAVGLAVLAFAAWRYRVRFTTVDWSFTGAIAAISALVVVRSFSAEYEVLNVWKRLVSIFEFDQGSALTRFQIWDAAWRATLDRPVFGFGPDTFRLVFPQYKPIEYVQTVGHLSVADNVHNYLLQLTSAVGIPGMLLLYGLFAAVAVLSARTAFARPRPAEEGATARAAALAAEADAGRLVVAGFWAACAAYVVHLTFALSVTGSTFLLWISMAALLAPAARAVDVRPPAWGTFAAAGVVVVAVALSVANVVYLTADHHYLKARLASTYAERLESAQRAVSLNPFNDMYRAEVGVVHADAFTQLSDRFLEAQRQGEDATELLAATRQAFTLAEEALLETIEFVPYEYDNYVFLANLYNRAGGTLDTAYLERAKEVARDGIELSEFGPAIRLQYAIALTSTGELDEARRQLEFAIEVDPRYAEGNVVLGDVLLRQGDPEGALEAYQRARRLRKNLPGIEAMIESAEAAIAGE